MDSSPVNSAFFKSVRGLIERCAGPVALGVGDFGRGDMVTCMEWTSVACGLLLGLSHVSGGCADVRSHRIAGAR